MAFPHLQPADLRHIQHAPHRRPHPFSLQRGEIRPPRFGQLVRPQPHLHHFHLVHVAREPFQQQVAPGDRVGVKAPYKHRVFVLLALDLVDHRALHLAGHAGQRHPYLVIGLVAGVMVAAQGHAMHLRLVALQVGAISGMPFGHGQQFHRSAQVFLKQGQQRARVNLRLARLGEGRVAHALVE